MTGVVACLVSLAFSFGLRCFSVSFFRILLFSLCVYLWVAVFPVWLSNLVLLAGDVERNPGPCSVCGGMLTRRNWQRCDMCGGEVHFGCTCISGERSSDEGGRHGVELSLIHI